MHYPLYILESPAWFYSVTPLYPEIPALPPPYIQEEVPESVTDDDEEAQDLPEQKFSRTSGPRVKDPYASDDSWFMPITIAVAVFLPVLFFLCRVK